MGRFVLRALVALCVCLSATVAHAGQDAHQARFVTASNSRNEINVEVTFAKPDLERDGSGRLSPHVDGLLNTMEAGLPSVPVKTLKVALPEGTTLGSVQLVEGDHATILGEIARAAAMVPMAWIGNPPRTGLRASSAPRFNGNFYPEKRVQVSLQYLHHVPVAVIDIYPLRVARDGKTSDYLLGGLLRVGLKPLRSSPARLFAHQEKEVEALVDNPDAVSSYDVETSRDASKYDYLIISTSDLIAYSGDNDFKRFQSALSSRGLQSKIVDLATVDAQGTGKDLPEKIRNTIKAEYASSGIRYVLLAGKAATGSRDTYIPARSLWSKIKAYMNGTWVDEEENIPSDFYYACLDGSFNGNGNDKWGEPDDGDNGGDVDFLCEVTVGRVALESTDDLQNFVRKTTSFYGHVALNKEVLLLGEDLFPELHLTGGAYMDQLLGSFTDHGFTTKGYPSDWKADKLYDSDHQWSGDEALQKINEGHYSMVNHLGHSNQWYNMKLSAYQELPAFTNATPFFYYTQGCLAGRFVDGSFVDKMVRHQAAAVAAVGNSTYGLSPEDPSPSTTHTPGASQMFHRQFINAVFGQAVSAGVAHQLSKNAFIGLKSAQEIRWVDWSATYFGDPSLPLNF